MPIYISSAFDSTLKTAVINFTLPSIPLFQSSSPTQSTIPVHFTTRHPTFFLGGGGGGGCNAQVISGFLLEVSIERIPGALLTKVA